MLGVITKEQEPERRRKLKKILQTADAGEPSVHTVQQTLRRLLKWLGFILLGCYVFLAVAVLGVRYWVLPNLDRWREPLQHQLSEMLSVQVQLGHVAAEWRGVNPRISLRDTVLRDEGGRVLLDIPALDAVVTGASLFTGTPHFRALRADGVALSLRRDSSNRISLVGNEVGDAQHERGPEGDSDILHWLAQQGNVQFTNARIHWLDGLRGAPPLVLHDVGLAVGTDDGEYLFSVRGRPPATLGASFAMQGRVSASIQRDTPLSMRDVSGHFHMGVEDMRPDAWAPWLDLHNLLDQGQVSWQGWQEVVSGVPLRHVSQVRVIDGVWRPALDVNVTVKSAQLYIAGLWSTLDRMRRNEDPVPGVDDPDGKAAVRIAMHLQGLAIEAAEQFNAPLAFDDLAVSLDLTRNTPDGLGVDVSQAQLRNADMALEFAGEWRQRGGGKAGMVDLHGGFERVELAAIVRYLPAIVDDEARRWMREGLLAGRLVDASLLLTGDLIHFPFGEQPESGDFLLGGPVHGVVIDYAPASAVGPPGWPRLEQLEGRAQLHRVDLTIDADSMQMRPDGHVIALSDVHARIPNIEEDSILDVRGTGRADATAFLSLVKHSPLAGVVDDVLVDAQGKGRLEVPIALSIPLADPDRTRVEGSVHFHDAEMRVSTSSPVLSGIHGGLSFTESQVTAQGLKARVLGGPVAASGGMGEGQKELVLQGSLSAAALNDHLKGQLDGLLEGSTGYRLAVQRSASGYRMRLDADLHKLAITLPAPLSKPAGASWPLSVRWTPAGKGSATLDISLNETLTAQLLHRPERAASPFFHAAAVNLGGKAKPPSEGLAADIQAPSVDIDAWRKVARGAGGDDDKKMSTAALFPPLRDLRLQSDKATMFGTKLDHLTFTARLPEGDRWRVDISSTQTAGTLFWQQRRGRVQGEVDAQFQRLALGNPTQVKRQEDGGESAAQDEDSDSPLPDLDDDIDIPAIRLKADHFRLYGRDVGALSVVGVNEARGRRWRLEQLALSSPHARLKGNGIWRLDGAQRGLTIQADAMFDDLGAYLKQIGFEDVVHGGHGEAGGVIEWQDVPWKFERSKLNGQLKVDLAGGRLLNVGSRSARLLELISLQSVKRLASLSWNPAGLMKQGFPFDTLQGEVKMQDGIMHSENYRVTGPVATIVIAGDVDLPQETVDLYAVVVPNLDVSGAAIAAGIAVNPIVGVGAFLTQWLLKSPMSKAMTVEYRVKGDLDSPHIEEVNLSQQKQRGEGNGLP